MRFTAGIDGGGTKTTVECRDAQGAVLCRKTFGAFNLNSIGEDAFRGLLAEITGFFSGLGGCGALCIGAAGVSNSRVRELTAEAVGQAGIRRWRLAGDHETALYGALAGGPGCALIAGTGSICCGRNAAGGFARAGGWGHLIDDGGSGYALGRDALAVFETVGLSVYARADFIVPPDGTPYFLEINTLPGMTPTSLVPQEAAAVGIDYESLCQIIADVSLEVRKGGG